MYVPSVLSLLPAPSNPIPLGHHRVPAWAFSVLRISLPRAICFTRGNAHTGFSGGSVVKNPPAMQEAQETWVWSLGQDDPLEEEMATHSSILAGKIPWTEEPGGQRSPRWSQRVGHHPATKHIVYISQCYFPNLSHFLLPPLCPQVHSPHPCLHSFPTNWFLCTIFSRFHMYVLMHDICFPFSLHSV